MLTDTHRQFPQRKAKSWNNCYRYKGRFGGELLAPCTLGLRAAWGPERLRAAEINTLAHRFRREEAQRRKSIKHQDAKKTASRGTVSAMYVALGRPSTPPDASDGAATMNLRDDVAAGWSAPLERSKGKG